ISLAAWNNSSRCASSHSTPRSCCASGNRFRGRLCASDAPWGRGGIDEPGPESRSVLCTGADIGYNPTGARDGGSRGVPRPSSCCGRAHLFQGESMATQGMYSGDELTRPAVRVSDQNQLDFELDFYAGILARHPDYVDVLRLMGNLLTLKGRY